MEIHEQAIIGLQNRNGSISTTYSHAPVELRGEDQALVIEQCHQEVVMPGTDAKLDLSAVSVISCTTAAPAIVGTLVEYKLINWENSLSLWLRSVIDFFGQQFYNYIDGLSEKMEKLEYY